MPWLQGVGGNGDEGGSIICAGVFTVQNAPLYIGGKNPSKTLQKSPLKRLTSNSPITAEANDFDFELSGLLVNSGAAATSWKWPILRESVLNLLEMANTGGKASLPRSNHGVRFRFDRRPQAF